MKREEIKEFINEADCVLIGIGEEYELLNELNNNKEYKEICKKVIDHNCLWVMPYVNNYFLKNNCRLKEAYQNIMNMVKDKDYFIISICTNALIHTELLCEDRLVEPCGSFLYIQTGNKQEIIFKETPDEIYNEIEKCILNQSDFSNCNKYNQFNSLYTEKYSEKGYIKQWEKYTKWLQKTVNKKLCIIELGSEMMFASVLRFRFEKIISLNKKSNLIRVNEHLYQLPIEIANQGFSINENSVDFMA